VADAVQQLEQACGTKWDAIRTARESTLNLVERVTSGLAGFETPSTSIVVTGSVGRGEVTSGSDFDWILLVDGPSEPNHFILAQKIRDVLKNELGIKPPGPTQTFGALVSSHDLVHYIAGTKDTNENLTRRILLLLESLAITNQVLRETVIRNVLARYIIHDRAVPSGSGLPSRIPHFLLNDVVRYWRTIASDFASKMWESQHKGWGIRNIKLRFSRKLLFVAGLLTCFSPSIVPSGTRFDGITDIEKFLALLADLIAEQTITPPLDKLARVLLDHPKLGKQIMSSYDLFLAAVDDPKIRKELEDLDFSDAYGNSVYNKLRDESHDFRKGINDLFFDKHPKLQQLIRDYGVF
jgi:predicted nucleotidyltransferase